MKGAAHPSLAVMKHNHDHVFVAHSAGWQKGEYVWVHVAPLRVLKAVGLRSGLDLSGLSLDDQRVAVENLYWTRFYDEIIDKNRRGKAKA